MADDPDQWKYEPAHDLGLPPLARMRSHRREAGLFSASARLAWWTGWSAVLRVWNRLRVVGREHLPSSGSYILVANHESHLDVFALTAALPMRTRAHFVPLSAEDVFFDRPTRTFFAAHILNALPVRRGAGVRHGFAAIRERLLIEPTIYALFPAGERSRDGGFLPFRSGIGMLVASTDIAVVPCHIEGAFEALRPQTKLIRPARMTVTIGAPRVFKDEPDNREGWDRIAAVLERDVRALGHEPFVEEPKL
ncbi:MAG: lysophospholipid acyltransferase family protein [Phycisphaerae bacterium]|nr:lysophospholipid acyltransferase family protein [Phycisphaerae bacterium]